MTQPAPARESELTWLSTRELAARIRAREVSAREALVDQLARIDAVDARIHAVVTRDDERALAAADRADAVAASGAPLGRLHGVPMTHKESTDTAGWRTTKGSPLLADRVPERDALVIARLHAAGVVMSGKTNVPELTAGSHTFNTLFGTTTNPYDPTRSAGGSSGGAAAAIAAGVQASGDGSDMGGSLRTPASFTNLVGLRPTNGRIPHALPSDPWQWLAQSGFMARSVSDVALLMAVASGPADGAPASIQEPGTVFDHPDLVDPSRHAPGSGLEGLRVAVSTDLAGLLPVEPAVRAVVDRVGDALAAAGAHVDDRIPSLVDGDEVFRVQRALDFVADYRDLVRQDPTQVKEAVRWNVDLGMRLTADEIADAREARVRLAAEVEGCFAHHDLLVTTTSQVAPFDASLEFPTAIDGTPMRDYLEWMRASTVVSATGCPAISVPFGVTPDGLPVGVQLVAAPGRDVALLLAAQALEEVAGVVGMRPRL